MSDSRDLLRYKTFSGTTVEGRASDAGAASDDRHEGGVAPTVASDAEQRATRGEHILFEELRAASPRWQQEWKTLRDAAAAYGLLTEYHDFMCTSEGMLYAVHVKEVHDYAADNAARRAEIDAEINMAAGAGFSFRSPV